MLQREEDKGSMGCVYIPFLGVFLAVAGLPSWPVTSCNRFSSSCFFSAIDSSLVFERTFLFSGRAVKVYYIS